MERLRYRLTWWQIVSQAFAVPFGFLVAAAWFAIQNGYIPESADVMILTTSLLGLASVFVRRRPGVELTSENLVIRGLVRTRAIAWTRVVGIAVRRDLGMRIAYFTRDDTLWGRAPINGFLQGDQDFDRKVDEIGRWWVAHRGVAWTPDARYDPDGVRREDRRPPPALAT